MRQGQKERRGWVDLGTFLNSYSLCRCNWDSQAIDARREVGEARREANDARREATETGVALADAKAEVWATQQAAKGKALGEDERRELEGAVRALSASAQKAAQEAGTWKENAESLKGKLESLNEELDNRANALALMENDLFLARQQTKDAEIQVHEASRLRTVVCVVPTILPPLTLSRNYTIHYI